jgi:hypothetical protein
MRRRRLYVSHDSLISRDHDLILLLTDLLKRHPTPVLRMLV